MRALSRPPARQSAFLEVPLVQRSRCLDRRVMVSGRHMDWQGTGVKVNFNQ